MYRFTQTNKSAPFQKAAIVVALAGSTLGLLSEHARAELSHEWIAKLPLQQSLRSSIQGMVVDAGGTTFVTGVTGSSSNNNVITAAFSTDGNLLWSQEFDGPEGGGDNGRAITLAPNGVVWVSGNTPGSNGRAHVLLLKYDAATGALLKTVQYSSDFFNSEHGGTVTTDTQGNVYVGGGTTGDGPDGLILKFDSEGILRWKKTWDGPAASPYSQDLVQQLEIDGNGDLVARIHGVMSSLHPDYVVVKYDTSAGDVIWESNWGMTAGDSSNDMKIDANGDIYVTGEAMNTSLQYGTIKLDGDDGSLIWEGYNRWGALNSAFALALDGVGGVYITGWSDPDGDRSNGNGDMYSVKRDAETGDLVWEHHYGDPCKRCGDIPTDILVDPDGNVFIGGHTSSAPYSGDMITLVLDADTGLEIDRGVIPPDSEDNAGTGFMAFDAQFNIYNAGQSGNAITGDPEISIVKYASLAQNIFGLTVENLIAGSSARFSISHATPFAKQFLVYSLRGFGSTPVPQLNITLDLSNPKLLQSGKANGNGDYVSNVSIPQSAVGRTVWFQGAELNRTTSVVEETVK